MRATHGANVVEYPAALGFATWNAVPCGVQGDEPNCHADYRVFSDGVSSGGGISEGSFVSHGGHVYRIAGGAPIYVSSWDVFGGPQPTIALNNAQFNALAPYPADGTTVSAREGAVYVFAGAPRST